MTRSLHRLTTIQVRNASARGLYADGGGLYLQVSPTGTRSWVFRYMRDRQPRMMGLGAINAVTLVQARELAGAARNQLARGLDPLGERHAGRAAARVAAAKRLSFRSAFDRYLDTQRAKWSTPATEQAWVSQFERNVFPVLGNRMCDEIATPDVLAVIEPIWKAQPDMGNRIRGRVESVLGWATASGFRSGENPARWRKHLDQILPSPEQVRPVENYASLEYDRIPEFVAELRARRPAPAELALELVLLTAVRVSVAAEAQWSEFDLDAGVWSVPAERMKGRRDKKAAFNVPLSARAIEIVRSLLGNGKAGPFMLDRSQVDELLARMGTQTRDGRKVTVHGMRASFRTWAQERTTYPRDLLEACLAHVAGKVERAYARGAMIERRREIMDHWSRYCDGAEGATVVALRRA